MLIRLVLSFTLVVLATGLAAQEAAVLTVTGTGRVGVVPDMAIISVGVEVEAETAEQALALNSARMAEVFATLTTADIATRDIQISQFSLLPQWRGRSSSNAAPPIISSYAVINVVTVRVRARDQVGRVLDALTRAGANRIQAVQFTIAAPGPYLDQARELAVRDALRKAGLFAAAAGLSVAQILSIDEGAGGAPGENPSSMRALAGVVPVAEGAQNVTASVTIRLVVR